MKMKRVYQCDYCDECFANETEAIAHEDKCGRNPQNRINNKVVYRLAMIYESLPNIISCALYEVAKDELDYLYAETKRADDTNCPFQINKHKSLMLYVLYHSRAVAEKHKGRNSSTYKDVEKENPELLKAMIDTLTRKAWNEQ